MLCRAYKACGGEPTALGTAEPFTDEEAIAPWASEAVHTLRSRDVLRGMGDGSFQPKGDFTIEQCAVCFLRLSEEMPVSFLRGNVKHIFTQEELIGTIQPDYDIRRWDGPLAVFISRSQGAVLGDTKYFLVYADGGIRYVPQGVPRHNYAFPFDTAGFSEDGKTFTYTVTVEEDEYGNVFREGEVVDRVLLAEAGHYTVVVDVLTGTQTVAREPIEPPEGRWDDVAEDAWYYAAAEYSEEWIGVSPMGKRYFYPEGEVRRVQVAEVLAHAYAALSEEISYVPLRPADWGKAFLRLEDGREFEAFQAWAATQWRTWTGPMNREAWHYSIRTTKDELTALFPELETQEALWLPATLDMGDKQVPGRLNATLSGDFEEGGPALLFYPEETSGYKDGGAVEPGAPTQLFLCAQPGVEESCRGIYFFAEKGLYYTQEPYETIRGWELAYILYRLWQDGGLPEETFRPIYDVTLPADTPYGQYLEPLYRAGILRIDDPDWAFDPDAIVTRAQWAVILWRFMNPGVR